MIIETKMQVEGCQPYRANNHDAGADLISLYGVVIESGKAEIVHTGVSINIPVGYVGLVFSRSGHAKKGLRLANSVGVIDSGYQGEIMAVIYNDSENTITINPGERVAQLVIIKCEYPQFSIVTEFSEKTIRGEGGFGSSGS